MLRNPLLPLCVSSSTLTVAAKKGKYNVGRKIVIAITRTLTEYNIVRLKPTHHIYTIKRPQYALD